MVTVDSSASAAGGGVAAGGGGGGGVAGGGAAGAGAAAALGVHRALVEEGNFEFVSQLHVVTLLALSDPRKRTTLHTPHHACVCLLTHIA